MDPLHLLVALFVLAAAALLARGKLARLFGLAVAVIAGLLGLGDRALAGDPPKAPRAKAPRKDATLAPILAAAEWKHLVKAWARLNRLGPELKNVTDWKRTSAAMKAATGEAKAGLKQITALEQRKLLTKAEARGLTRTFNDRIGHLRRTYSGRTCYRMTRGGRQRQATRSTLERQLQLIDKLHRAGKVQPAVLAKAAAVVRKNLARLGITARSRCQALVLELSRAASGTER